MSAKPTLFDRSLQHGAEGAVLEIFQNSSPEKCPKYPIEVVFGNPFENFRKKCHPIRPSPRFCPSDDFELRGTALGAKRPKFGYRRRFFLEKNLVYSQKIKA